VVTTEDVQLIMTVTCAGSVVSGRKSGSRQSSGCAVSRRSQLHHLIRNLKSRYPLALRNKIDPRKKHGIVLSTACS
jgi:hypothetical protein